MRQFRALPLRFSFQVGDEFQIGDVPMGGGDFGEVDYIAPGQAAPLPGNFTATVPQGVTSGIYEPYRGPATRGPTQVPPRYKVGDEWTPQSQSWDPVRIADMQAQLVDAGLLDPDDYQRGFWDDESATAYRQLLGYSNVSGLDSHQTLQRIGEVKARFGGASKKGPVREPFVAELTDPAKLNSLLDDVSVRLMGRGLSPEEKARFSDSFRGVQEAEQRKAYEAYGSGLPGGPGGSVTMPDAEGRAEEFIYENRPKDVAVNQYLEAFQVFENLLSRTRR